jgi:hypothetical protein
VDQEEYKHEFAFVEDTEDPRGGKPLSEQRGREGEMHHPRAQILRNPDNLGMALQLGKHLLAQTGGGLRVNPGVLDVGMSKKRGLSQTSDEDKRNDHFI